MNWTPALNNFLTALAEQEAAGFREGLRAMSNAPRRRLTELYKVAPAVINEAVTAGLFTCGEREVTLTSKGYTVIHALQTPPKASTPRSRVNTQRKGHKAATAKPVPSQRTSGAHANCSHPATKAARAACRKARG